MRYKNVIDDEPSKRLAKIAYEVRIQKIGSAQKLSNSLKHKFSYFIAPQRIYDIELGKMQPTIAYIERLFRVAYGDDWFGMMVAAFEISYQGGKL